MLYEVSTFHAIESRHDNLVEAIEAAHELATTKDVSLGVVWVTRDCGRNILYKLIVRDRIIQSIVDNRTKVQKSELFKTLEK